VIPSIMVRPEYHQEYKEYCTRYNNQKEDILNALKLLDYINARPSMIFRPLKLRKENTMLFPLLFRMVKMMKDRADNNDMYIDYKQNSAFVSATIDEIYFSHAIFNLLDNAVKYAYDGSRIHVNMKVDNNQQCVIIEVESYGIQILEGERIYDLFFRGETVSKSNLSGMGIGMFLVRKICRAHGGDITHSSTLISEMNVPVLFALSRKRSIASKLSEDERDSCIKEYTRLSSMEEIIVETSSFVKYPFVFKSRVFQPTYKNVFSIKLPLV